MASAKKTRTKDCEHRHGYDVKLLNTAVFEKYKCPLCKFLIRNPIQTERGQLACGYCYKEAERDDGICPIDGELIESNVFRDKGKERDILKLLCYCSFLSHGCSWQGELGHLEDHLEDCQFKPINCKLCQQEIVKSHLSSHLEICPKIGNGCAYKGCSYKAESAQLLKQHLHDNTILHTYLHSAAIIDLQEQIDHQSSLYEDTLKEKLQEIDTMKAQMSEMSKMMKVLLENKDKNNKVPELEERINILERNASSNSESGSNNMPNNVQNCDVENLQNQVAELNKNLADLDLRQRLFENTSYNGILLWKIDNIDMRRSQAISGRVSALHSAPVFVERNGYKFCARLYLNGDGIGKGKHVSLFFVIMKSEFDNLLPWPFQRQVTFKLKNQEGKNDVVESFMPDKNSSSFVRPKKDMNIASGCPTFIDMDTFRTNGFIKNDCIFIEVHVGDSTSTASKQ